jgi:transcriptional regulator with XRE-family HTH domain
VGWQFEKHILLYRKGELHMKEIDLPCVIKRARERMGLTRIELSRAIGLSDSMVSKYEAGYASPTQKNLIKICAVLGLKYPIACKNGEPEYRIARNNLPFSNPLYSPKLL